MRIPVEQEPALKGVLVVFLTLDQLRACGPLALRMWLERNRPTCRVTRRRSGEVLEFRTVGTAEVEG